MINQERHNNTTTNGGSGNISSRSLCEHMGTSFGVHDLRVIDKNQLGISSEGSGCLCVLYPRYLQRHHTIHIVYQMLPAQGKDMPYRAKHRKSQGTEDETGQGETIHEGEGVLELYYCGDLASLSHPRDFCRRTIDTQKAPTKRV